MDNIEKKFQNIINSKAILIYGAKIIASKVIEKLREINPLIHIIGCAVSSINGNENELMGLPVKVIDDYQIDLEDTWILIAIDTKYHEVVKKELINKGYKKIYAIDSVMENLLFKTMIQEKLSRLSKDNQRGKISCGN